MLQEWRAMVTPVHCAHHPSLWCPRTDWGELTSIPSPTLAEFPREAWHAAANRSVLCHLALPLVLARVWQAGVWAPLDMERNPWPQAMGVRQLTCSKGRARKEMQQEYLPDERFENSPHCRKLCTAPKG